MLLVLVVPGQALSHATLTAPETAEVRDGAVRLLFDTPVEQPFLRAQARAADGTVVSGTPYLNPDDDQELVVPVTAGAEPAVVAWRVLSTDGHVTSGTVGGTGGGSLELGYVLAAVGRVLVIAGLVLTVGLVVVRWLIVGAAWRAGGCAPPGRPPGDADGFRGRAFPILEWAVNGWWAPWWTGLVAWTLGVALVAVGTLRSLESWGLWTLLTDTRLGVALVILTAGVAAAAVAGVWLARRTDGDDPLPPVWQALLLAVPGVAGLLALSATGHASTGGEAGLNILLDAAHNVATAAWIGGLVGLVALLLPAGSRMGEPDRLRLTAAGVVRFSTLGIICVAVLATTGVYRLLAELDGLGDLLDTGYGQVLLAKIAVFAVMLGVAGVNRLVLHPRLERGALGLDPDDRGAGAQLARSVRAELVLAALVLVLVGLLLATAPPG